MVSSALPTPPLADAERVTVRRHDLELALAALRCHARQIEGRMELAEPGWLGDTLRSMLDADAEAVDRIEDALRGR